MCEVFPGYSPNTGWQNPAPALCISNLTPNHLPSKSFYSTPIHAKLPTLHHRSSFISSSIIQPSLTQQYFIVTFGIDLPSSLPHRGTDLATMAPSSAAAKEETVEKAREIVVNRRDDALKVISIVHDIFKRTISPDSECAKQAFKTIEPAFQYLELTNNYIRDIFSTEVVTQRYPRVQKLHRDDQEDRSTFPTLETDYVSAELTQNMIRRREQMTEALDSSAGTTLS
ncbi:hypothetical protein GJ744_004574 [Endocarpon pusillum]|uniref:Uncharacterized protein n=1 Tax=Endocarpon pusillum TaxID=364733 RepID=A0A8H7AUJ7_9EURO|nr:hypothetical protein GJ744_004574 [Endocarpon pusillum]